MADTGLAEAALVLIARAPQLGRVKTRLAASFPVRAAETPAPSHWLGAGADASWSDRAALDIYRQLLARVARLQAQWPGPVLLASAGEAHAWIGTGLEHLPRRPQPDGSLGRRIAAALTWGLSQRTQAIAIGADCPGLDLVHLHHLVAVLAPVSAPIAFGPATDGGYWGIALTSADAARTMPLACADDLPWSTPQLLHASQQRLSAAGITAATGAVLADCDDADDLAAAVAAGYLRWPSGVRDTQSGFLKPKD